MANTLSDEDSAAVTNVLTWIDALKEIRGTMPIQFAYTFLLVATEEGLSVSEYAKRANVPQSVMTRHLLDLGLQTRKREPGLGLLTQRPDPMDMRKQQTFLTPKGKALLHRMIRAANR